MSNSIEFALEFHSLEDLRSEAHARLFFEILENWSGPFAEAKWGIVGAKRTIREDFDTGHLEPLIECWQSPRGFSMWTKGKKADPFLETTVILYGDETTTPRLSMIYPAKGERDLERFLDLARDMYSLMKPVHGFVEVRSVLSEPNVVILPAHHMWTGTTVFRSPITYSIPEVFWTSFYGKPLVDMLGADRFQAAPCDAVEQMPDGGFMLGVTRTPEECQTDEGYRKRQVTKAWLGEEYFWQHTDGTAYRTLPRRLPGLDASRMPRNRRSPALQMDIYHPSEAYHSAQRIDPEELIGSVPRLIESLRARVGSRGAGLDCSRESLNVLDGFLKEQWLETTSDEYWDSQDLWMEMLAYVGEVVRTMFDGTWKVRDLKRIGPAAVVALIRGKSQCFDPMEVVAPALYQGLCAGKHTAFRLSEWFVEHKSLHPYLQEMGIAVG